MRDKAIISFPARTKLDQKGTGWPLRLGSFAEHPPSNGTHQSKQSGNSVLLVFRIIISKPHRSWNYQQASVVERRLVQVEVVASLFGLILPRTK